MLFSGVVVVSTGGVSGLDGAGGTSVCGREKSGCGGYFCV